MKIVLMSYLKPELRGVSNSTWFLFIDGNIHITDIETNRALTNSLGKVGIDYKMVTIEPEVAKSIILRSV